MNKNDLQTSLRSFGWELDSWGHYKKTLKGKNGVETRVRVKIQKTSVRFERLINLGDKNEWILLDFSYFKDLKVGEDEIIIGRYKIRRPK